MNIFLLTSPKVKDLLCFQKRWKNIFDMSHKRFEFYLVDFLALEEFATGLSCSAQAWLGHSTRI